MGLGRDWIVALLLLLLLLLLPSTPWSSWRRHAHGDVAQTHGNCHKLGGYEAGGETRWVPSWQPARGRYLVMICTSGQVSNHLVCLRKHMWFAALLNRTLVLPPGSVDYQYDHLLDIAHLQRCLAGGATNSTDVVMTFQEFQTVRGAILHVDELICYMRDCYFDKEHQSKWEALGFIFGPRRDAWVGSKPMTTTTTIPRRVSREEIVARFGGGEEQDVVAVGDLFYAEVEEVGGFEVASQCRGVVRPHRSIATAAERFVQTYLGGNFVAVHFRRHGFLVFCNKQAPEPSCFYPIPQAARCIERAVRAAAADVVFLSTDAPESEATALVAALARRGVDVVRRSAAHEPLAKWDAPLWRMASNREAEPGVMALVDQSICALAATFVGTRSSSFSAHIQHLRNDMLTASTCDAPICHNLGPPSFQAPIEP